MHSKNNNNCEINIFEDNRFYWEYKDEPIFLTGGSIEDNLFQVNNCEQHLDLLSSVGGNYIRNTMSSRDKGNIWPFEKQDGGYDLTRLNFDYWDRFETLLSLACERDIIVQIELWDRFDFARDPWNYNPFNPMNNVNYSEEESGLKTVIETHPGRNENRFFYTVPNEDNNTCVLAFQKRFCDKLLSISLNYPNVLYCMDNETCGSPEWGIFWSLYIKDKAQKQGVTVHTTEMWDAWDLKDEQHKHTLDHPEIYSFCDVSQNNQKKGQEHWDNFQHVRSYLIDTDNVRPLNTVKTYGADSGKYGSTRDGIERFWRHIFGGAASVRFHRPVSGLGLSKRACSHLRSLRMLLEKLDIFSCEPANIHLCDRNDNDAYCISNGDIYAVFFPSGGSVFLEIEQEQQDITLQWLDTDNSSWDEPVEISLKNGQIALDAEGRDYMIAYLCKKQFI